jgi:lipopolysaccharide export system protein LptA
MKSFRTFAMIAVAAAAWTTSAPADAQTSERTAPVVVRSANSSSDKAQNSAKGNWMKGEVIHADSNEMVVREEQNGMMIHTFTYTPAVQARMQIISDAGGYQYGDKVKILYQTGQTIALKIRGKPSKSF